MNPALLVLGAAAGLAYAGAPYVAEQVGRGISRLGVKLGGTRPSAGARLVKSSSAEGLDDVLRETLEGASGPEMPRTVGGTGKALRSKFDAPVANPDVRSGLFSTQPDKWGVTKIGTDLDDVMTTARGGSGRGPVIYKDPAELLAAAKRSGVPVPLEKFKALWSQIQQQQRTASVPRPLPTLTAQEAALLRELGGNLR